MNEETEKYREAAWRPTVKCRQATI